MKCISKFKTVSLFGLVFILAFGMIGCGDDSNTTAVTNPSSSTLNPTGNIQGILRDTSTLEPIVNAVIDIGVSQATTSATGQFVLRNVPVTTDSTLDGTVSDTYEVTIDMRHVTSPVNMTLASAPTGTYRYADFYFREANALFTSLDDTNGTNAGGGSGTNHDTPVTGLSATVDFLVGQMSATLTGVVAGCDATGFEDDFFTPVGAGYTVVLTSASGSPEDTASGATGNIVGATTTDANGAFTFANIEAGQTFNLTAKNADSSMTDTISISAIGHMLTDVHTVQASTALHVCSNDVHGPTIIAVSPEPGSDQAASATQTVVFTFNEAIKQTAATSTDASGVDNLYDNIDVMFAGSKASNIAYTAAWNASFTQLTVTFATAASGKYYVRILNIDDKFTDANLQGAAIGVCPEDSLSGLAATYAFTADAGTTDAIVYFTTEGGLTVAAPTVAITNATSLNNVAGAGQPVLDWLGVSGATSYNVYRSTIRNWSTLETFNSIFLANVTASTFTDVYGENGIDEAPGDDPDVSFDENGTTKLTYSYTVTSVNSDTEESADSTAVVASDALGPQVVLVTSDVLVIPAVDAPANTYTVTVTFNEPMDEARAETGSYWTIGKDGGSGYDVEPVITAVRMVTPTTVALTVTLTRVDANSTYSGLWYLGVSENVIDVSGNNMDSDADLWHFNNDPTGAAGTVE